MLEDALGERHVRRAHAQDVYSCTGGIVSVVQAICCALESKAGVSPSIGGFSFAFAQSPTFCWARRTAPQPEKDPRNYTHTP